MTQLISQESVPYAPLRYEMAQTKAKRRADRNRRMTLIRAREARADHARKLAQLSISIAKSGGLSLDPLSRKDRTILERVYTHARTHKLASMPLSDLQNLISQ